MNAINSILSTSANTLSYYTQTLSNEQSAAEHNKNVSNNADTVSISVEARAAAEKDNTSTYESKGNIYTLKYGDLNAYENMTFMEKAYQSVIDNRTGLDREKVEEINEKMEAIINDKSIPAEEKAQLLESLAKAKEALYKKAAELTEEQAKLKDAQESMKV